MISEFKGSRLFGRAVAAVAAAALLLSGIAFLHSRHLERERRENARTEITLPPQTTARSEPPERTAGEIDAYAVIAAQAPPLTPGELWNVEYVGECEPEAREYVPTAAPVDTVGKQAEPEMVTLAAVYEPEPAYVWVSLGYFTIAHYCLCVRCTGIWSAEHPSRAGTDFVQLTASGTVPTVGRTVAINPRFAPFGSELWIYGYGRGWIAEDTGTIPLRSRVVDVLVEDHQTAVDAGIKRVEVWVREDSR